MNMNSAFLQYESPYDSVISRGTRIWPFSSMNQHMLPAVTVEYERGFAK